MADQHIGYPGSVGSTALATWLTNQLAQYSVEGPNDCKVVTTGGTRGILVGPGTIFGDAIQDVFESATPLTLASVSSGDRWDMVVLRRTWSATPGASTSVFTVIQGSSNKALPTRLNNKGVQADQPIALCRVSAGQSTVQEIVDLRVWAANGGAVAVDPLVKDYLTEPGTTLRIGNTRWIRQITPSPTSNTATWYSPDVPGPWVPASYYPGWRTVTNGTPFQARLLGNGLVHVVGECLYEGPGTPQEGWSPGVLPQQFWSPVQSFIPGMIQQYSVGSVYYTYQGEVRFLGVAAKGNVAFFNGLYSIV